MLTLYVFLALRAGLEVEWAAVEKSLRKAVKKYVRNKSQDAEDDQEMSEVQIAENESLERYNNNNNSDTDDNVYGAVIVAKPLWEFTRFIWWIWNGAKRPPTLSPGHTTQAVSPPVEATPTISIYYS